MRSSGWSLLGFAARDLVERAHLAAHAGAGFRPGGVSGAARAAAADLRGAPGRRAASASAWHNTGSRRRRWMRSPAPCAAASHWSSAGLVVYMLSAEPLGFFLVRTLILLALFLSLAACEPIAAVPLALTIAAGRPRDLLQAAARCRCRGAPCRSAVVRAHARSCLQAFRLVFEPYVLLVILLLVHLRAVRRLHSRAHRHDGDGAAGADHLLHAAGPGDRRRSSPRPPWRSSPATFPGACCASRARRPRPPMPTTPTR